MRRLKGRNIDLILQLCAHITHFQALSLSGKQLEQLELIFAVVVTSQYAEIIAKNNGEETY